MIPSLAPFSLALAFVVGLVPAAQAQTCPTDPGAALAAACPCDGEPTGNGELRPWRNHGHYVSCVVRFRNDLRQAGCLTAATQKTIARCAARSTCGKEGTALCCTYRTGECSDPLADGIAAGTCSNDGRIACDVAADCTVVSGPRIKRPEACTLRGGTVIGTGSVCVGCPPQPPAP